MGQLPGTLSLFHAVVGELKQRAGGEPFDNRNRIYAGFGRLLGNINLTGLDEMSDAAATAVYTLARRDLVKQPLVDPTPRQEGLEGINEGGGLHADHDDHEPVASSSRSMTRTL